jgi:glycine betaine/proline transport system permease protein
MEDWFTFYKIPFGAWMKAIIDVIQTHGRGSLDVVRASLNWLIEGLSYWLLQPPPIIIVLVIAALAWWLHRSIGLVAFIIAALAFILNQGYWGATMETLALVVSATLLSVIVGVPLGIWAAHRPMVFSVLRPILDIMQTLPTFVYLVPTLVLFGLGVVPGLISTIIFAIPAPIRMTRLGIASVPRPLIEAGEAFGATRTQLLFKVELPYAVPTIMAGVNQCIMLSLSMVVIAALVGAGGLGKPVVRALNTVNIGMGFEAGFAIVLLAIVIDRIAKARAGGGEH